MRKKINEKKDKKKQSSLSVILTMRNTPVVYEKSES